MIDIKSHLNNSFACEKKSESLMTATFTMPTLPYYEGHFPDFPVLPAVGLVDVTTFFVKKFILNNFDATIQKLDQLKIKAPVTPGQKILITVETEASGAFHATWNDQENPEKLFCDLEFTMH